MKLLLLGGYGNGDWLPILGVLVLIGCLVQLADVAVKYYKNRQGRKRHEMEQAIINQTYTRNTLDNFSQN